MRASQPVPAVPSPIARLLGDGEGQLHAFNSITMSSKLQAHRNSLAEPLFKTKQKAMAAGSMELVQLKKSTAAMSRDFQGLLTAHERQEAAATDLRQKVRVLRQELEQRDKALDLARRTMDRLRADKGQLEAGAAGTQAYVRKLEARLLSVKQAVELQQRCEQYKVQLDGMAHAVHEADSRAAAADAAAQQAQLEGACLKRGLELAAEQLTKSSGAEIPGTLLRAVARGQEEALALSRQLADAKQQVSQLATALEQAREHLQAQQQALTQHQSERQELQQRIEAGDGALEKQRATTSELRRVLDALKPKAGVLAEERDALRRELELERTTAAEAQKEIKKLRAALRQKATTEAALRDELRRTLAGGGLTPAPPPPKPARLPEAAGPPLFRSGSRQRQLRGAELQAQPPHKAVALQAAWERRQPQGAASCSKGSLSRVHSRQRGGDNLRGSPEDGFIAAEPSPARALLKLQEQRRQQQGSRLGVEQARQAQQQAPGQPGWQDAVAGWHADLAEGALHAPAPASATRPVNQPRQVNLAFEDSEDARHHWQHQQVQAPAPLPVQDRQLMQFYTSALDAQIAALETDLVQLGLEEALSPIAQLQQQAKAAPGAAAGPGEACRAAKAAAQPVDQQQSRESAMREWRQQPGDGGQDAVAAWRPNSAFDGAAAQAAGRKEHQLLSPGADTPALNGGQEHPVPPLWHNNPLAGSPAKQRSHEPRQAEGPLLPVQVAADALTVRAREVMAPVEAVAVAEPDAPGASGSGRDQEWPWGDLQQAMPAPAPVTGFQAGGFGPEALLVPGSLGSAASSPSLRLQGALSEACSPRQQGDEGEQRVAAAAAAGEQQQFALQPWQSAAAEPATSDSRGGHSLSNRWDLPSPGPGNSDWLSNEFEADIEHLEVNSGTPLRPPPAPQLHGALDWELAAAAFATGSTEPAASQQQEEPAGGAGGAGSLAAWAAAGGSGQGIQAGPVVPSHRQQPILPSLALVSGSPQLAAQLQQQQQTLFDLAGMDMADLLSA